MISVTSPSALPSEYLLIGMISTILLHNLQPFLRQINFFKFYCKISLKYLSLAWIDMNYKWPILHFCHILTDFSLFEIIRFVFQIMTNFLITFHLLLFSCFNINISNHSDFRNSSLDFSILGILIVFGIILWFLWRVI